MTSDCSTLEIQMRLKLGQQTVGTMPVKLRAKAALKEARASIQRQASEELGHEVAVTRFIVTLRGRSGYLRPELEECPVDELAMLTSSNATVELVDADTHAGSPRQRIHTWPQMAVCTA